MRIIILGIYASLGYVTFFFGRPAFIELWRHGYTAGLTTADRPELNLMVRFFMTDLRRQAASRHRADGVQPSPCG